MGNHSSLVFDGEIKKLGVKNAYFPCFVSERALNAEKNFIAGFSPEVAWVTEAGKKPLNERIAIRPTSETIMYPMFAKWVQSHRDLPLKLNQWCNVVRWEMKHPVPFLRGREFLWQEGHSAFASKPEADEEVLQILELYRQVYEDLLAIPVVKGKKTDEEKFAGALYTTTIEAFVEASGRAIQAATSHCLGQNFAQAFDIKFEVDPTTKAFAWQNSWGLSTRSLGIMVMIHGDDKGLVLPPRVAPTQIVIVPIFRKNNIELVEQKALELGQFLKEHGLRVEVDLRNYKPGWKYNHWENKGVPIRIEIGGRDIENNGVTTCRRDKLDEPKLFISSDNLVNDLKAMLDDIHHNLYNKAKELSDSRRVRATTLEEFSAKLNGNAVLVPFCETKECEDGVKAFTENLSNTSDSDAQFELTGKAKSLCIPFDQPELEKDKKCFACDRHAVSYTYFGRSY